MRTSHRVAAVVLIATAFGTTTAAASDSASSGTRGHHRTGHPSRSTEARCSTWIRGSRAAASCFNPDAVTDRVALHVECARWWDPDMDGRPVPVGPAQHIRLAARCWKEIRGAWVTHR